MPGGMGQLMEQSTVILGRALELLTQRHNDTITSGTIKGSVPFAVLNSQPLLFAVSGNDFFGTGYGRKLYGDVSGGDTVALVNVEHIKISEHGDQRFNGVPVLVGVLDFDLLPGNHKRGLFAFADVTAALRDLFKGEVFAGFS